MLTGLGIGMMTKNQCAQMMCGLTHWLVQGASRTAAVS
jgi:hypothetical protein